jgi:hypothetical protein
MIQTVELEVMNGRYTIAANVELKAVPNSIEVDGHRDTWTDYEYVVHEIVSLYDNGCDEYIPTGKQNEIVEDVIDEIIDAAIEKAANERP